MARLGCGCAVLVGLALTVVVGASVATWRAERRFERMRDDPDRRRAAVREVLPHREPPPGYRPVGTLVMPFGLLKMALLADAAPGADGGGEHVERALFFVDMPDWMGREQALREVFEGKAEPAGGIRHSEVEFEAREELGRGKVTTGGAEVLYYARRGTLSIDDARFGLGSEEEEAPRREMEGIATMLLFDCAGDDRLRLGLWFGPDPAPDLSPAEADLSGTPADPAAMRALLGHFVLCG